VQGEVPLPVCLAEAIESLLEPPEPACVIETIGRLHVYFFIEGPIQVSGFDVELSQFEVVDGSNAEEGSYGVPSRDGGKSEREVLPRDLGEAFCHQACFEACDVPALVAFDV